MKNIKTKNENKNKNNIKSACLALGLLLSGTANAGLINANFNNDLQGWTGSVDGIEYIDNITDFSSYSDIFTATGGELSLNQTDSFWNVSLYQEFTFDGNASQISLNYYSTDIDGWEGYATLKNAATDEVLWDFYDGLTFDVSSFAALGQSAILEFSIIDFNLANDTLFVSDIEISLTDVPEPSSFVIFALGLLAFRHRVTNRNITNVSYA